jgi:hypothetical protein
MMRSLTLFSLLLLSGCNHVEPAVESTGGLGQPFQAGDPLRLTYSDGYDGNPSFIGSTGRILYAFDRDLTPSGLPKGCVGDLPASGGSRGWEICDASVQRQDSSTVTRWPALRSDGMAAFVRQRWSPLGLAPYYSDLVIQRTDIGAAPTKVIPIPFSLAGKSHQGISHLQWLDHDHLVWLGLGVIRSANDNVESGSEIDIETIADTIAGLTAVPGTTYASSVEVGGNGDTLYYTLNGDSLVYRRTLSTGAVDTVFDFGNLGIARDVRIEGQRLVAVVGGAVSFIPHPTLVMAQYDSGGPVYVVDLPAGVPTLVTQAYDRYRFPALSRDGSVVVAQQFGDLWAIALP